MSTNSGKRLREEGDRSSEESTKNQYKELADLKSRYRSEMEWPAESSATTQRTTAAEYLYRFHDRPHPKCQFEWWYVNGHIGCDAKRSRQFSFFAAFFKLHVAGDAFTYASNWALIEVPLEGGKPRYHHFSKLDQIAPPILVELIRSGQFTGDKHVLDQMVVQMSGNNVAAPDRLMERQGRATGTVASRQDSNDKATRTLEVDLDGCELRADMNYDRPFPTYRTDLRGKTLDQCNGDTEVTAALSFSFEPEQPALLQGREGLVRVGDLWEDDMFYYFTPRCRLSKEAPTVELTINGERIPIIPILDEEVGSDSRLHPTRFWIDHEFGGAVAATQAERDAMTARKQATTGGLDHQWEWGALHIPRVGSVSMTVLRSATDGHILDKFAVLQPEDGGSSSEVYSYDPATSDELQNLQFDSDKRLKYKSFETGKEFPNSWTLVLPHSLGGAGLRLDITAAFAEQEFATLPGRPSYWEGLANVKAARLDDDSRISDGYGFMECHGHVDPNGLTMFYTLMHALLFAPTAAKIPRPTIETLFGALAQRQPPALDSLMPLVDSVRPGVMAIISAAPGASEVPKPPHHMQLLCEGLIAYGALTLCGADASIYSNVLNWIETKRINFLQNNTEGEICDVKGLVLCALVDKELQTAAAQNHHPELNTATAYEKTADHELNLSESAPAAPQTSQGTTSEQRTVYDHIIPSLQELTTGASPDSLKAAQETFAGVWEKDKSLSKDDMSSYLALQSVSLPIRYLTASLSPTLRTTVVSAASGGDSDAIVSRIETAVANLESVTRVDGVPFSFESQGRGTMHSRATLQDGGHIIAVAQEVPSGERGREYKFISVSRASKLLAKGSIPPSAKVDPDTKVLQEVLAYYTSAQVEEETQKGLLPSPKGVFSHYFVKKD